jgi:hypothetical protein
VAPGPAQIEERVGQEAAKPDALGGAGAQAEASDMELQDIADNGQRRRNDAVLAAQEAVEAAEPGAAGRRHARVAFNADTPDLHRDSTWAGFRPANDGMPAQKRRARRPRAQKRTTARPGLVRRVPGLSPHCTGNHEVMS